MEKQSDGGKQCKPGLNYLSIGQWAGEGKKREWLWDKLVPLGHLTLLQAAQKCGKSTLVRNLIACALEGKDLLGRTVKQGAVIYLPLEEDPFAVKEHLRALGVDDNPLLTVPAIIGSGATANSARSRVVRDFDTLAHAVREINPVLVVIDPLALMVKASSLNIYEKVYEAMQPFIDLSQECHCAIVFLHHESKSGSGRKNVGQRGIGSVALPGSVSTTISMSNKGGMRTIEVEGRGVQPLENLILSLDANGKIDTANRWEEVLAERYIPSIREALAVMSEPLMMTELQMLVRGDLKEVKQAIYFMIEQGVIQHVTGRGVKGDPKRYALAPASKRAEGENTGS
jgi:hypothetical protein